MLRGVFGFLAGLILALILITAIQLLSGLIYPVPPEVMQAMAEDDLAPLAEWIENAPMGALAMVLLAYGVGSFGGGYVAGKVGRQWLWPALAVGAALTLFGFMNLARIPHPSWFAIASSLIYIPLALAGGRLGGPKGE